MKYISILFVTAVLGASAQALYELPFASGDNTLELTIENTSTLTAANITVTATDAPSWLRLDPDNLTVAEIPSKGNSTAVFSLTVDKSAPTRQEQRLSMTVTTSSGQSWKKEVMISVAPPVSFELLQNYPNPFNPATTIEYQLPAESNVSVKVFDLLGREVARLVNGQQQAGSHRISWDATRQASGMYVYELVADSPGMKQHVVRKTMMLVR